MLIKEIMTKTVHTLTVKHRLYHALQLMQEKNIRHIVIISNHGIVSGIVSDRDLNFISHKLLTQSKKHKKSEQIDIHEKLSFLLTINEVMTEEVIYCLEDQNVKNAVDIMLKNKIHALPVVSSITAKKLIGIVTVTDIMNSIDWKVV
jgi:acetoin utilization protein AcuB